MQEKIYFENSKGDKLCGILSSSNKENPLIILSHGFASSKESSTNIELEKVLNENNISTFRFDFYGHGESEGKFENITISEGVDEVLNCVKFLKEKGYKKLGLVGGSFGGIVSILAASKLGNGIYLLVLKCPVSNHMEELITKGYRISPEKWKEKGFLEYQKNLRLNYSFYEDSVNIDGYKAAESINIPTLIVHGDKDEAVPVEQSKKVSKIIKDCKLEIIEGANHRFSEEKDFNKMIKLISEFIIKNIKK
ncbi:hypothetical protein CL617_04485 [archaeon]|nr:hypothetical protein [archaeon]